MKKDHGFAALLVVMVVVMAAVATVSMLVMTMRAALDWAGRAQLCRPGGGGAYKSRHKIETSY